MDTAPHLPGREVVMFRIITVLAVTVLAFAVIQQRQQITTMQSLIADADTRVGEMERRVAAEEASYILLQRFISANHKRLNRLMPKRTLTVTAYSPRVSETDDTPFSTATNRPVRSGIIAVSRDLFDSGWVFGRKVYIKSYGIFTIDDLMAKSKRNQIDIFMHDTDRAIDFGRKTLDVYLLDLEPLSRTASAED